MDHGMPLAFPAADPESGNATVIKGLFGSSTTSWQLRGGLEELSATHRSISERIANASQTSASTDFEQVLDGATGGQEVTPVSEEQLQVDMAALADTQLRFEAAARLLQKAYADLRISMRSNG
jgi:hypothetical protein